MQTIFDWVTIGIFAALVVLFLQRSVPGTSQDTVWHYLPAAAGCALANYLGNEGQPILAAAVIAGVLIYTVLVLKPFGNLRS